MRKIVAFPFAGGNKYSYSKMIHNSNEFIVLEYPGRGTRSDKPLITNLNELIEDMFNEFEKIVDEENDYIIYGHSMGALIAYFICLMIEQKKMKQPDMLVVSGAKAPFYRRIDKISHLDNESFWAEITKIGGIPKELKEDKELIDFFTPILKADFRLLENYSYSGKNKINIPIDVFYGSEEDIEIEQVLAWKETTHKNINIQCLPGDHFFIFKNNFLTKYINE